ncbi:iron-containing alcohol dehydrogenase family protein [Clostridium sardiniense]|uniref:iron-containing alcohol dehydrogenase family protein n=1 Tax=Clostridium sardiniense TaxID=29369 RepID=UPI001958920F|nr:iron-containing alcohol dehydrogenase family protein [Clostridium sardiniense]MBM7833551.1 alcohol dehydrogenase [Clostridium sardiniense]
MRFNLKVPTQVFFGENTIKNNCDKFNKIGNRALIVMGGKSAKLNGALSDILTALDSCDKEYYIFDKVEENPSLETIEAGSKLGKAIKADFVIGIGGGSPLDAAKAISLMINNPKLTKESMFSQKNLEGIPVIAVPTTAGTGSEVTQYAIVTDHIGKVKRNLGQTIYPKMAFIDSRYTEKLNIPMTRNTAMDAFSHIVEGYLNSNATEYTDKLSQEALKIWGESLDGLLKGSLTKEDRNNLMMSSTLAGVIISKNGTSIPHGMGYALTYHKGVPHGLANCCLYNEYLDSFKNKKKVNNIVNILGFSSLKDLKKVISKLSQINLSITEEEAKKYTDDIWNNKEKLKNHPEDISYDELYNIYYKSLVNSGNIQ